MPTWAPDQYLQFARERTRPCRDLVRRVEIDSPRRIIDLGCGPGNSTAVIAERWPGAVVTGLDSSAEMIEAARRGGGNRTWMVRDISEWAQSNDQPFDAVVSNAALQWVGDHGTIFPRLLRRVAPGGALAVQMPGNYDAPAHLAMRELATSSAWRPRFPADGVREWHVHDLAFYYDALGPYAARLDFWETEYLHVMRSAEAIVDWYKGTGLRPFLDVLAGDGGRAAFLAEYLAKIRELYPPRADGKVLFPFRRLFMVAYR
jgi:trans-aconitate 2-methyltransferase